MSDLLVAHSLSKRFGGVEALRDASLSLPQGRITALLGPNGAGKTTMFNLLTGRLQPDHGAISFDGHDVARLSVARRARLGIGRTFQDVRLFGELTAGENVAVYAQPVASGSLARTLLAPAGRLRERRASIEAARAALDYVGAAGLERRYARDLSYAEQKLVSIARLLAMESQVLLLDEPASGVDDAGRERLMRLVERLAADGRTVCLIEHNLDVVRRLAERVVFLAQGTVVADGDPGEILASAELAEIYLGERRHG